MTPRKRGVKNCVKRVLKFCKGKVLLNLVIFCTFEEQLNQLFWRTLCKLVTTWTTFLCKIECFWKLLKIVEFRALGRARGGAQNGAPRESQKMTNLGPDPFRTRLGRAKMIGNCMGDRSRRRKSGVGKRPPKKWSFSILTSRKFPPPLFDPFLSLFWTFLKISKKLIKYDLFFVNNT